MSAFAAAALIRRLASAFSMAAADFRYA